MANDEQYPIGATRERLMRLKELYKDLPDPENHPEYRRLRGIIDAESMFTSVPKARGEAVNPPQDPPPDMRGRPVSTTTDKAQQEERLGIRRKINPILRQMGREKGRYDD